MPCTKIGPAPGAKVCHQVPRIVPEIHIPETLKRAFFEWYLRSGKVPVDREGNKVSWSRQLGHCFSTIFILDGQRPPAERGVAGCF